MIGYGRIMKYTRTYPCYSGLEIGFSDLRVKNVQTTKLFPKEELNSSADWATLLFYADGLARWLWLSIRRRARDSPSVAPKQGRANPDRVAQ